MSTYNVQEIESKWQKLWQEKKCDLTPEPSTEKEPFFMLVMFPYPSGHLHMGHVRNYTIADVIARYQRRLGKAVLHPIGWDAFGLPAENAAIQRGINPADWTWSNIAHMREQLKTLAISYDWEREVATCDPNYYKWNQWIFIQMYKKGLVFRKKAPVNWCPKDNTVLANEQVHDGKCWRCKTEVIQKELSQWFFKITDYAQALLDGHDLLRPNDKQKGWPEKVITMQKNWIGASKGAFIDFNVSLENSQTEKIRVFTTRPDTLFGATFMVLAPEHPLVEKITTPAQKSLIEKYRENAKKLTKILRTSATREKTGEFTGSYAVNPVNNQKIPIWIADYVLTDYGTGAIMAVPAHDERDFAFAQKFNIPIIQVIKPKDTDLQIPLKEAFVEDGVMVNSGEFNGLTTEEAKAAIPKFLKTKGLGELTTTYKLKDWLLSRQRYWGTPIPMIYCDKCGISPVNESELPVVLPKEVKFTGSGDNPLAQVKEWVEVKCPQCAGPARRETDTMDTFVDSSWYYARYTDAKNTSMPFDPSNAKKWLPVTQYVGGIEHACMHLIYSRFFHKVFYDMGLVQSKEPFSSLLTQGMVTLGGTAMSKSKGNVVDPITVISKFGSDTCRLFILFAAPPTQELEWSDSQVEGIWRFVNRVWRLAQTFSDPQDPKAPKRSLEESQNKVSKDDLIRETNVAIHNVTKDIDVDFGFNTAISNIMTLVNAIYLYPDLGDETSKQAVETVIQLLFPFAPHMTEELWQQLGHTTMLAVSPWPKADKEKMALKEIEVVVQVNGKLRGKVTVPANSSEEVIKSAASKSLEERGVKITAQKVIYVPNKLVNFVGSQN